MPKAVILFDKQGNEDLYRLSLEYKTKIIHEHYYNHFSPMFMYKAVQRAILYKENPTKELINFMFPKWVGEEDYCILKNDKYKYISGYEASRYSHAFLQPTNEWVLVGHTYNNNGRWYTKETPRSLLK